MIEKNEGQFLWVESYRPKNIDACVLPERLKSVFKEFVKEKQIPNLLLTGSAGVGKTTVAKALCEEVGCDYIIINGSSNNGVDTVRYEITEYASSVSLSGGRKVVIVDEADYLSPNAQAAFRNLIEQFAMNCTFIFTCNFKEKMLEPIHSRCAVIEFKLTKEERTKMASLFFKRIQEILKNENVETNDAVVAEIIKKFFPDFRRVLNELQRYSKSGKIDVGVLAQLSDETLGDIVKYIRDKDFASINKWIRSNEYDSQMLYRKLFDELYEKITSQSVAELVIHLSEYQYKRAFVADTQINDLAMLTSVMLSVEFKK